MTDERGSHPPPAYPPPGWPPPPGPGREAPPRPPSAVPWNGKDIALVLVGGGALAALFTLLALIAPVALNLGPSIAQVVIVGLVIYGAFCLSAWFFAIRRPGATLSSVGLRAPESARGYLIAIPATIGAIIMNFSLVALMQLVFEDVPTGQDQLVPPGVDIDLGGFLGLLLLAAVAAPIVEEFLFRGVLFRWLRSGKGLWFAATVSALVFALVHGLPTLIPPLFGLGFLLALVVERTQSLFPAMIVHACNNALAVVLVYMSMRAG